MINVVYYRVYNMSRGEVLQSGIDEIELVAARQVRSLVLEEIGKAGTFPTAQLSNEEGYLTCCKAVIVNYGVPVPNEGRVDPVLRDAVVLLPEGLFVGKPVETIAGNGNYSTFVPVLDRLRPAPLEAYWDYGKRALELLNQS